MGGHEFLTSCGAEGYTKTIAGDASPGVRGHLKVPQVAQQVRVRAEAGIDAEGGLARVEDVSGVKAGDARQIPLTIRRAGALKELRLRLIEESDFFNNEYLSSRAGLKVAPVRGGGFVVQSVDANGPAAAAGLKRGHLIRGMDRTEFPDVVALARYVFSRPKGETVEVGVLVDQRTALGVYRQAGIATLKLR